MGIDDDFGCLGFGLNLSRNSASIWHRIFQMTHNQDLKNDKCMRNASISSEERCVVSPTIFFTGTAKFQSVQAREFYRMILKNIVNLRLRPGS